MTTELAITAWQGIFMVVGIFFAFRFGKRMGWLEGFRAGVIIRLEGEEPHDGPRDAE